jgi:hypothetical protein
VSYYRRPSSGPSIPGAIALFIVLLAAGYAVFGFVLPAALRSFGWVR